MIWKSGKGVLENSGPGLSTECSKTEMKIYRKLQKL